MTSILIVTHGEMGNALLSTLGMILGATEGVAAVTLKPEDSLETLQSAVEERIRSLDPKGEGALVLVDMLGGTPFNCAMQMTEGRPLRVITGVNLPMLFKAVSHRGRTDLDGLARDVQQAARASILTSVELLKKD